MTLSPSSRHSSPGIDRLWNGRRYPDDLIPRRLTASPVARIKDRDRTRKRLSQYHTIDHAVQLLKNAKNVVVLTGAGISTSLNIPDFRSDGGFYSKLSSSIGITTPEEFFSLDFFTRNSESFWDNVKPLLPRYAKGKTGDYENLISKYSKSDEGTVPKFSKTHAFLALLAQDKLLTNYTQNIDGLEFAAGVNSKKIIQCHGSWDTATCFTCKKTISAKKYLPIVFEDGYPRCKCVGKDLPLGRTPVKKSKVKKRKRAIYEGDSDHDSDDGTKMPKGLYKPDITFFGEPIPEYYVPRLEEDKVKADLLLILGTSLKVRPVKTMLVDFPPHVPQIWINKDRYNGTHSDMPGVHVDIELLGECDIVIEELCRRAGFPLDKFTWKGPSTKNEKEQIMPVRGRQNGPLVQKPEQDTIGQSRTKTTSVHATPSKLTISETQTKPANGNTSSSEPTSTIRVVSDLDAEWRWRFTKKPTTSSGSASA
ncbi:NAD-dependent histone deacetylase sir2 [Knufia fluminis]|uniref:NAD-dependent histone deacetylase sir2 n=2 Tax=Knufia TaxID=430999 RepID=A0AAN8EPY7_9EURO|nr:NAD-dependent histone deacetylase sir2 [Knufia fluminis]